MLCAAFFCFFPSGLCNRLCILSTKIGNAHTALELIDCKREAFEATKLFFTIERSKKCDRFANVSARSSHQLCRWNREYLSVFVAMDEAESNRCIEVKWENWISWMHCVTSVDWIDEKTHSESRSVWIWQFDYQLQFDSCERRSHAELRFYFPFRKIVPSSRTHTHRDSLRLWMQ